MTDAELIAKIKAEIERLKEINKRTLDGQLKAGCLYALNQVLPFLDTLESEKPINQEGLDKEIEKVLREGALSWNISYSDMCFIAEHFYELGCRRTAEKYDEIEYNRQRAEESVPKDLEEVARLYAIPHYLKDIDMNHIEEYPYDTGLEAAFIAGAKWQADHTPLPEDTVLFNKGVEEGRRLAEEELSDLLTIAHLQGADQMKEQMLKDGNVILTEEDFEAEKEKSMEWGYNLCKEQMMKDAVKWLVDDDYHEASEKGRFILGSVGLGYNGYYIPYSDLLKLPKEDEK